jgi:hypothetical protein
LVTVKQRQLVDKDRPQREAHAIAKTFGGYRLVALEEGLEVLVKVLD